MQDVPSFSDQPERFHLPQIPGNRVPPIIGPDVPEGAEITAPEVTQKNKPAEFAADESPYPESNAPEPKREAGDAVAKHAGELVTPAEITAPIPVERQQPEAFVPADPEAAELGRIFDAMDDFNVLHNPRLGISERPPETDLSGDEAGEQERQYSDNEMFQRVHGGTLAAFGLDVAIEKPGFLDIRVQDGSLLVDKLAALPDGTVPESFLDGFQKLAGDFPIIAQAQIIAMDFDAARETGGLDVSGVFVPNTPDEPDAFAENLREVTPEERNAIAQTLAYADGICDKLAHLGVPEESLQTLRAMKGYHEEGMLTEWAVAGKIDWFVDLDYQPSDSTVWGAWDEPEQWDGAFKFLDHIQAKSQPEGRLLPDLIDRMDTNLERVITEQAGIALTEGNGVINVDFETPEGTQLSVNIEIPPEVLAEAEMKHQAYIGLLREVQERLRRYR